MTEVPGASALAKYVAARRERLGKPAEKAALDLTHENPAADKLTTLVRSYEKARYKVYTAGLDTGYSPDNPAYTAAIYQQLVSSRLWYAHNAASSVRRRAAKLSTVAVNRLADNWLADLTSAPVTAASVQRTAYAFGRERQAIEEHAAIEEL